MLFAKRSATKLTFFLKYCLFITKILRIMPNLEGNRYLGLQNVIIII